MTLLEKIDLYLEAREAYEEIHKQSSDAHAKMKALEYELVDEMLDSNTQSHGAADGVHISLRKQYSCSVTQANETLIREWLVETEGDDSQFVVEKVHKPALIEWMKGKDLEPEDAPDFLKLTTRPGISLLGWDKRVAK